MVVMTAARVRGVHHRTITYSTDELPWWYDPKAAMLNRNQACPSSLYLSILQEQASDNATQIAQGNSDIAGVFRVLFHRITTDPDTPLSCSEAQEMHSSSQQLMTQLAVTGGDDNAAAGAGSKAKAISKDKWVEAVKSLIIDGWCPLRWSLSPSIAVRWDLDVRSSRYYWLLTTPFLMDSYRIPCVIVLV